MNKLLNKIKGRKMFILSPHYDDAVLSCGWFLENLSKQADISIMNVFTSAHDGPHTLSAKKYLRNAGYSSASLLYLDRAEEDKAVLASLGVKSINLGIEDALFRRKQRSKLGSFVAEIDHIYPTYRWHVTGKIKPNDPAIKQLENKLQTIDKNCYVFAPLGMGGHVDHQIVRSIAEKRFPNLILYSDFPYSIKLNDYGKAPANFTRCEVNPNIISKSKLIKKYKSQYSSLFSSGEIPLHKEVYFVKN